MRHRLAEHEERWYHHVLFLMAVTVFVTCLSYIVGAPFRESLMLCFGGMGVLTFVGLVAESIVMGMTARTGGFFCFTIIAIMICVLI